METKSDDSNLIVKYFRGDLTDVEMSDFKSKLSDANFRNEVKANLLSLKSIENEKHSTLLSSLGQYNLLETNDEKAIEKIPKNNKFISKWIIVGAVFLACCFASYHLNLFETFTKKSKSEQLFAEYYKVFPVDNNQRNSTQTSLTDYNNAMNAYAKNDFKSAIGFFEKIEKPDDNVHLYLGICFIELESWGQALSELNSINSDVNSQLKHDVDWYQLMIFLQTNDKENSRGKIADILKELSHPYYLQTKEIEKKLMN